jgi:hypothetical protein
MRYDARTRIYLERRTHQGLSKPEIIRCLKRYIAREIYNALQTHNGRKSIRDRCLTDHRSIDLLPEGCQCGR